MITIPGDYPFEFTIVFPDYQGTEFIDIYCFSLETVFQGPDLHTVFQCA